MSGTTTSRPDRNNSKREISCWFYFQHQPTSFFRNGSIRNLHVNKLRKFIARVNAVGVVYDQDIDFGHIVSCPEVNPRKDEQETIEGIKNLDLTHLSEAEAEILRALLLKHKYVFSNRPGTCDVPPHEINLIEGFKPKVMHPYHIPESLKEEVDKQIDQLLEDGKIVKSYSHFGHPIVCVKKEGEGGGRICTDLRC